ncbi:MAG: DUF177 domain-containing protein [Clostridia bacterium]|nr:DUF177 domain-containing protein [Clostridia bacterium]
MLLQLQSLFMGEKERLPIEATLNFSEVEWNGEKPFQQPLSVVGCVEQSAGVVTLRADVRYRYDGTCDRCTGEVHHDRVLHMEHILVVSLNHEDNDSFVLIENYQLPLDELVEEDLLLDQPSKILCKEDCRGLCPQCGKDLNQGPCDCRQETTDPRLAVLKQLLE